MSLKKTMSVQSTIRALGAITLAVALAAGCGPLDEAELEQLGSEADEEREAMATKSTIGTSPATFKVAAIGAGGQRLSVSGTLKDGETGVYKTVTDDQVYMVTGATGIASVPLPAMIRSELNVDLKQALASGALKSANEAVYFVHKATAEQVAAGTLSPPAGVTTYGYCSDYDKTLQKTIGFDKSPSYSKTFSSGGFNGSLYLSGRIKGSATGTIVARIKRKWCVPYWARLKTVRVSGSLDASARITSSGSFADSWSWKAQILKYDLGGEWFFVGLPIYVGFNLPVELGLEAEAKITAKLDGSVTATGTFDVTCTASNCSGARNFNYGYTNNSAPTASLNTKVKVKPWIQGSVRAYLYRDSPAYGQVGVKSYLEGELWGYAGNSCGDADNDGKNETVYALTLDAHLRPCWP